MARPSDARARFIRTAAQLFCRHGYHGVGLTRIIEAADAPKGSFYHHFPEGKEELAEHAMLWAANAVTRAIIEAFAGAESFAAGSRALASQLAAWTKGSDFRDGCPITGIALGTIPESQRLSVTARNVFDGWLALVASEARRLGHDGLEARNMAMALLCALEGAWLVSRMTRSTLPFESCLPLRSA
jgi:TetR/AcrR family transcriptional repressor of lmrAB and yxaGH operons